MSTEFVDEFARMTENLTASKIVELSDVEIDAVAGGLMAGGKEDPTAGGGFGS